MTDSEPITPIILVTGATRNVGAEVVRQLSARHIYARAAVQAIEQARAMGWQGVELVPFDYDRPATYPAVLTDVARLLLVMPPGDFEQQVGNITQLIDAAVQAGVQQIVFISAMGTEKLHISGQWAIEQHLMHSGVAYTILRSGWFFQNLITNPGVAEEIRQGVYRVPFGDAKISGVDVRDVAAVAVAALTEDGHANQVYSLGEHVMDAHYVASILSQVVGHPVRVEMITEYDAAHRLRAQGMPREVAKWWRIVYQLMQQGVYASTVADISRVLGRPSIPFKQFAQDYADVWRR